MRLDRWVDTQAWSSAGPIGSGRLRRCQSHDVWAGIDAGKIAHHCVVINDADEKLLSRKVSNDEADLLRLIKDVAATANSGRVQWALDLNAGGAALLITLLVEHQGRMRLRVVRFVGRVAPGWVKYSSP